MCLLIHRKRLEHKVAYTCVVHEVRERSTSICICSPSRLPGRVNGDEETGGSEEGGIKRASGERKLSGEVCTCIYVEA